MSENMFATNFTGSSRINLSKAILLYEGGGHSYATVHDAVFDGVNKQSIGTGRPVDIAMLGTLVDALGRNASVGGFLPSNVLSVGFDSIVWWVKPASRRVFFKTDEEIIGDRSEIVPHPGLLFGVNSRGGWSVCAVKGTKRPESDTPICQAPYFNVWNTGNICTGTVETPNGTTVDDIAKWEECFFNSYFVHPNVHVNNQLINDKNNPYQFWKMMLDGKYKTFPSRVLVKTGKTVRDFIKQVNGN
jgi:PRTRC genetic system protein B